MKIKALLVIPNKEVQIVKIPASNKFLEAFIGNELYKKCLDKNNILIAKLLFQSHSSCSFSKTITLETGIL